MRVPIMAHVHFMKEATTYHQLPRCNHIGTFPHCLARSFTHSDSAVFDLCGAVFDLCAAIRQDEPVTGRFPSSSMTWGSEECER